jgi:hypothetical protein
MAQHNNIAQQEVECYAQLKSEGTGKGGSQENSVLANEGPKQNETIHS